MAPIVDAHVHLFRRRTRAYPRAVLDIFPAEAEALAEPFIERIRAAGVSYGVVVALSSHYRYLGDCLERWPATFRGIGVVAEDDPDPADSFIRWRDRIGLAGMRTGRLGSAEAGSLDSSVAELLAALMAGHHPLWFYGSSDQLLLVPSVAERYPDLPIVLNHLGFCPNEVTTDEQGRRRVVTELPPPTLSTVRALARYPNVIVMFSGQYAFSAMPYPHPDLSGTIEAIVGAFGTARMMWASDFPASMSTADYEHQLALVDAQLPGLSAAERQELVGGTAAALFGLPTR